MRQVLFCKNKQNFYSSIEIGGKICYNYKARKTKGAKL